MRALAVAAAAMAIAGCWVFRSVDALPVSDEDAAVSSDAGASDATADARSFRRPIVVVAGADDLPLGYSIRVPLAELGALVDQGKVRSDLSDVRVRLAPQGDERDRIVDVAPEGESPAVWFSLAAPIAAHATETRYELDYGDRNLGRARTDGANVFVFFDDFAGPALSPQRWITKGTIDLDGGVVLRHGSNAEIDSTATMPAASSLDVIASMSQPTSPKHTFGYNAGFRWSLWLGEDPSGAFRAYQSPCDGGECTGPLIPLSDSNPHAYRIDRAPRQTRYSFAGQRPPQYSVDANDGIGMPLSFTNTSPNNDLLLQRVRVRLLATDEPTVTLGPEQALP